LPESISSVGAIKLYGFFFFFHERSDRWIWLLNLKISLF
jgi:hypothetical protein